MKTLNFAFFRRSVLVALVFFLAGPLFSQTLIMNEVSNGQSGNKEYVEFVVTDTAVTYDCGLTAPPCIDIRGWIFDDNSGYHGAGGIAVGAVRFSYDPLWSCVPVGTIILIYNNIDVNPDIPAMDVSLTDGNCRVVVPINNTSLFETNGTTPGAVACSYPATGWTAGGNWNTTLLANTGDCARIVNTSGCEVFSVCWATCSSSTLIYFPGSGGDKVWYFNGGDPNNQANWTEGCADPTACGVDDQTPGSANNAANAAYIAQFNNGCTPITPITSSISSFTNASCTCDGTATVSSSGSIPGYTYTWYDAAFVPIGQTAATATGLCAGTYYVISESSIGCSDTATVTITASGTTLTVNASSPTAITCEMGTPFTLTGTPAGGTWSGPGVNPTTGSFNPSVSGTGTITIVYTVTSGGCTGSDSVEITVTPDAGIAEIDPAPSVFCVTDPPYTFTASPPGGFFYGSTALTSAGIFDPGYGAGTYVIAYQLTGPGTCKAIDSIFVQVIDTTVNIIPVAAVCDDAAPFNLSATPTGGTWSGTGITNATLGTFDPSVAGVGTHTITYNVGTGSCTGTGTINITVGTGVTPAINPAGPICENQAAFNLTASPAGGTWTGPGVNTSGLFNPTTAGDGTHMIIYTVPGSGGCAGSDTLFLQVDNLPTVNITPVSTLCTNSSPTNLLGTPAGGTWSGTGITSAASGTFNPLVAGVGTHTITYTVTNGTCTVTSTVNVTVVTGTNITISALGPLVFCQGGSVQLVVNGAGSLPVTWSNNMTGDTITVTTGGNYYAMVNSGCGNDTSNIIPVTVNTINASFILDPSTGQAPLEVNLINTTTNSITYAWSVNDTTYAVNTDTSIVFDTTGYFDVTIYVVSPEGCIDSLTQTVYVYGEFTLTIPNIFTPNGDHANDFFSIQLAGVRELNVDVFNRWGQLMHTYANTEVLDGKVVVWDGKAQNGDFASDGVYAFILKARAFTGDEQVYKGFVTLIKSGK